MPNRRVLIRCMKYMLSFGRPGPDLSWITGLVGVSGSLQPCHIPTLAKLGVRSVIDLRQEDTNDPDLLEENGIRYLRLPTRDYYSPSLQCLVKGAQWVLDEVQAGRKTVVHCKEGIGRSICVVCSALMLSGNDLPEAIHLVKSKRWGVALNARQMLGLKEFEQTVLINRRPFTPPLGIFPRFQQEP